MKYLLCLLSLSLLLNCKVTKNDKINEDAIVGTWEFVQTEDGNGVRLESYKGGFGTIKATGPELVYRANHTYKMVFTPQNVDSGKWKWSGNKMTIDLDLFIDSTDWIGKDLIQKGEAIKQNDSKYYERIEVKILKISKDEMKVNNRGLVNVYKKLK